MLYLSARIDNLIDKLDVYGIYYIFFAIFVSLALQDIGIDALMITIFDEETRPKGGLACWLGQTLGSFVAYNMFVVLNAYKIDGKPWLSISTFLKIMSLYILISSLVTTLFVAEMKTTRKFNGIKDVVKTVFNIVKRKGTLCWILWAVVKYFGMCMFFKTYNYKLVDLGFKKEWIANISTIAFPVTILLTTQTYKYLVKGKLNFYLYNALALAVPMMIYQFLVYTDLDYNRNYNRTYVLLIFGSLGDILVQIQFILEIGFLNTMTDENIGGTHLTTLASILNMSRFLPTTFGLYQLDYVNYYIFSVVVIAYSIGVLLFTKTWA